MTPTLTLTSPLMIFTSSKQLVLDNTFRFISRVSNYYGRNNVRVSVGV